MFNTHEEYFKPTGDLKVTITNPEGEITKEFSVMNTVVATGKSWIAGRLKNTSAPHTIPLEMTLMEIGTDSNPVGTHPVSTSDTTLVNPLVRVNISPVGGEVASNVITYTATFAPSATYIGPITEAGIFNAANIMLCRTKFPPVNKAAADTMTIVWSITAA